MNLDDLTIPNITTPVKEAVVVSEPPEICSACECTVSRRTPQGTCSICGAVWEDEEADDFSLALKLLSETATFLEKIFNNRQVVKKLSYKDEVTGRDLAMEVAGFVDMFNV